MCSKRRALAPLDQRLDSTLDVSVVETQLSDHQCITLNAVHHAMLIRNAA